MAYVLGNKDLRVDQLFSPQALTTTTNGTGVDLKGAATAGTHEFRVHVNVGTTTGTSPTLVLKIQDSPDNSTFTDVANATTGSLTGAGVTDFYFRTTNRYVRAVATLGGTSPSFTVAIDLYSKTRTV